ncbi:threonine-phosphate decarboxylase CobD [Cupriavidus sp. 2TAF22]|uniref:threonine-phosphate decarboxylase CobD n=1 Tax=unclassified Cupriavidus TaxID=2640874 RepID=UPI003F8E2C91
MTNLVDTEFPAPIPHGGDLRAVVRRYGIPREKWIDLSTGINPVGYPVPPIDADAWLRLPDDHDDLEEVAAQHYRATRALVMPGSQAAIRMLPKILPKGRIGVGYLAYGEYERAFSADGFPLEYFVTAEVSDVRDRAGFLLEPGRTLPADLQYLVVVNPNNPGAELFTPDALLAWHSELAARGGALIVDEAFIDATPEFSVASHANVDSLIVLRSVGKFFGLAGARVGTVITGERVHRAMEYLRGQWTISGPARVVTRAALLDGAWHRQACSRLTESSARFVKLLGEYGLDASRTHTPLFAWTRTPAAEVWQDCLARHGIWTRRFENVPGLRMSLPPDEHAWMRIEQALRDARHIVGGK